MDQEQPGHGCTRRSALDLVLRRCVEVRAFLEQPADPETGTRHARALALLRKNRLVRYAAVLKTSDGRVVRVVSDFDRRNDAVGYVDRAGWAYYSVVPCEPPPT